MMKVNGKYYPMWSQFVERKAEWIGKRLQDFGDSMDQSMGINGCGPATTTITDITLDPNGDESAAFSVHGKDFTCGADVGYLRISPNGEPGWLEFSGYMGHRWRIESVKAA